MVTYLGAFLLSVVLALLMTPIVIKAAFKLNFVDMPSARKVHSRPMPRVGGIAVFLSSMVAMACVFLFDAKILAAIEGARTSVVVIFLSCGFIFLLGLIDDLRDLKASIKLMGLLSAVAALYFSGVRLDYITLPGSFRVDLGLFSFPLTALWIIGITTSLNFIDGLDGLASGISAITCLVIAIFALSNGQTLMAVVMLSLMGSLFGFLFFNFNPAKIFLGDCGSMFLGFMIASISLFCAMKSETVVGLALPVLVLGLPIVDTFFTLIRRYLSRRRILSSDYGHLHHKLLDLGLSHRNVVILLYLMTAAAGGLGLFMLASRDIVTTSVIFTCIMLMLVMVFRVLGVARIHSICHKYSDNARKSHVIKNCQDIFERAQLKIFRVATFEQFCGVLEKMANEMDFLRLTITLSDFDCIRSGCVWDNYLERMRFGESAVRTNICIKAFNAGPQLHFDLMVSPEPSLELAGQKIMFFSRLIEEFGDSGFWDGIKPEHVRSALKDTSARVGADYGRVFAVKAADVKEKNNNRVSVSTL
ncbi:MAG: undecaprenyl/decaprenyl-phosphate alpha-N-acetylglucosaminyl 1-phosphate transferase [Anaerohalosphaera sp.]|nr:undecaprenyl/decaprenyl-phosphate alpha-N-acetylglucosaminyl 1-phosphate transferase [Anaerohalosphaera sp.]